MRPSHTASASESATTSFDVKSMITWRGVDTDRLEQVRLLATGDRIKADGRIIAAATDEHAAYSASYELLTTDTGMTRRLTVHVLSEGGITQLGITRDGENNWLVQTPTNTERSGFEGAEDVDIAFSPLLNALPFRRRRSLIDASQIDVPVAYLSLPDGTVEAKTLRYTARDDSVEVVSPKLTTSFTVDDNGFVVDYARLATRV